MGRKRFVITVLVFLAVILAGLIICINAGYTKLELQDFLDVITGTASKPIHFTLVELRLPRVLTVMLVGIGLSVSGAVMQGVCGNDLAEPGILGLHAGAGLAVALCMVFVKGTGFGAALSYPMAAFIGAALTGGLEYFLAYTKEEGITPNRLILTGVAVSAAINAVTIILLLRMKQDEYGFIEGWLSGNIWGASWENIKIMTVWIGILLVCLFYKSNTINMLTLGSQTAKGLGVSIQRENILLLLGAVGLASICAAVGGGISFVGLLCPHFSKRLVGPRYEKLIPVSALCGAALLLIADALARTVAAPNEISIGIVAAIIGAPYFLFILVRREGEA